jgi:hypothetical protein
MINNQKSVKPLVHQTNSKKIYYSFIWMHHIVTLANILYIFMPYNHIIFQCNFPILIGIYNILHPWIHVPFNLYVHVSFRFGKPPNLVSFIQTRYWGSKHENHALKINLLIRAQTMPQIEKEFLTTETKNIRAYFVKSKIKCSKN